jgi:hypothetical protein
MHFGVLSYSSSINLGDEVQSLSCAQYLPQVDFTVDRDTGTSTGGGKVLLTGWFDGQYTAFPPPHTCETKALSIHVNERPKDATYERLSPQNKPGILDHTAFWAKQKGQILCRDEHTAKLMKERGMNACFGGCLTMTLERDLPQASKEFILVVDAHVQAKDYFEAVVPEHIRRKATYVIQNTEEVGLSHAEKMERASKFLLQLQRATLVITSRLHTVLPARFAFNVPTVFIFHGLGTDPRLSGWRNFVVTPEEIVDWNHIPAPVDMKRVPAMTQRLREEVWKFLGPVPQKIVTEEKGNSIVVVSMDRTRQLRQSVPSFIAARPREIVLLCWSAIDQEEVKELVRTLDPEHKLIKLILAPEERAWNLTQAYNLAIQQCRCENVVKVDADTVLAPDFFVRHNLDHVPCFFSGDWTLASNENELHLNGLMYMKRQHFFRAGGFNGLLVTYGWDDSNLQERCKKLPLEQHTLRSAKHIPHDNVARVRHQQLFTHRLDAEIELNRLISLEPNLWRGEQDMSEYRVFKRCKWMFEAHGVRHVQLDSGLREHLTRQALLNRSYNKPRFYLWPRNGLCNRMRALAAGWVYWKKALEPRGYELHLIWPIDMHLEAAFEDIFQRLEGVFLLREPPTQFFGARYCHEETPGKFIVDPDDGQDLMIRTACRLETKHIDWEEETRFLRTILKPTARIQTQIDVFAKTHGIMTAVGVHIRMGQQGLAPEDMSDYANEPRCQITKWRMASHWTVFADHLRVSFEKDTTFFVCCDNEGVFEQLKQALPDRKIVQTPKRVWDRSLAQIESAVMDVYLLGLTRDFLGSCWSSFSELGDWLGPKRSSKLAGVHFGVSRKRDRD